METVTCGLAALAVAKIYYWYRAYSHNQFHREKTLRERVTFMLYVAAVRS